MDKQHTTAYVYDPRFLDHDQPGHPEGAARLVAILEELQKQGLLEKMQHLQGRDATQQELELGHTEKHIATIRGDTGIIDGIVGPDAYKNPKSWNAARLAVGSTIELCHCLADGSATNGFAFVRPPGHHALKNMAMGFCLFNNVALAAKSLITDNKAKKVAIVDFDVHHGNGTQAITQSDPNILFVSSHQHPFYPGTGAKEETGKDKGKGTVVNIPLPFQAGDKVARAVYSGIVFPVVRRFRPDFILVSAGYDAHWKDPMAQLLFSASTFSWLSQQLVQLANELCGGKIVFALEGGYHLKALAESVANSCRVLMKQSDFRDTLGEPATPQTDIGDLVQRLRELHGV